MNIRDSYIHGADGKGVVKSLFFVTAADVQADNNLHLNDLGIILADVNNSTFYLTIPTLNLNTTGYAALILTKKKDTNANYYLTFVDSNNNSETAESVYTNADIYFNPTTGPTGHVGTLHVNNISGDNIGITIGNTFVVLGGTYTPDTVISNTSTDNTIPSSKAVWDAILTGIQANDAMVFKGFLTGGADIDHTAYTPAAERGDTYKVSTAGWINGNYYQVNDTFICTVDSTAQATSSNVSTVKTNWGVVEGNGDYLSYNGGTMYGTLSWDGTIALPEVTTASSILVVDSNTTKQISLANLKIALDVLDSSHTHTVKINNSDKVIYITGGTVTDLGSYLPLSGGTLTGDAGWTTDNHKLYFYNNAAIGKLAGHGLTLYGENNTAVVHISDGTNYYNIVHTGNISNKDAIIGTSLTTIATIAGIDIKAKIGNYLPSDHVYSLSIATAAAADINQITLATSAKYKLTAGGSTFIFTTPADTWRNIYTVGTSRVGTGSNTKAMNFASSNLDINYLAAGTSTGLSGSADYFTINLEAKNWTGATSSVAGTTGYMPGASTANRLKYLRGDGNWRELAEAEHWHPLGNHNLVKGMDLRYVTTLGSYYNVTGSVITDGDGFRCVEVTRTSNTTAYWSCNGALHLKSNTVYTWSYYVKCTSSASFSSSSIGHYLVYNSASTKSDPTHEDTNLKSYPTFIEPNVWTKCWIRFKTNNLSGSSFNFFCYQQPVGSTVYLRDFKLEEAEFPSGWLPNDEDFRTGLHTVAYADMLTNARTFTIGNGSFTFDGSSDVSLTLALIGIDTPLEIFKGNKTLVVSTWETITDISSLSAGTYAIQINSGTVYASGVFTACHGTDSVIDEIPLHVTDSASTNTWRPYARISGANLQMTTNEGTGTSRQYTINIIKLI